MGYTVGSGSRTRRTALPFAAAAAALALGLSAAEAGVAATYRVRPGDTLSAIAAAHRSTVRAIARLNRLDPNGVLLAGTVLRLPSTPPALQRYRVRPGDSLGAIAAAHGSTVRAIARLNRLDPHGVLLAGAVLRLPSGKPRPSLQRYRIQAGDSLSGIADRYGTSVGVIARLNALDPTAVLLAGRTLVLPERQSDPAAIRSTIAQWARRYSVRQGLALGLAWQESGDQPDVVSSAGAWGVMQVLPTTWTYVETVLIGRPVPHTADGGIRVGIVYLSHLLDAFGRNERLAVAAYLQGERSVREHGVLPTSEPYVANVLALAG